jgi:hypothetical protein
MPWAGDLESLERTLIQGAAYVSALGINRVQLSAYSEDGNWYAIGYDSD